MNGTCCEHEDRSSVAPTTRLILPKQTAPSWSGVAIKNSRIVNISSEDYRGRYHVLLFYPHDFDLVCPTELLQFSDRVDDFAALDSEVVAVSTDSEFTHLAWATTQRDRGGLGEMRVTMLSDKSHRTSRAYEVLDEAEGISHRALFVVDDKMILRHVTINDAAISRSVDEVLRVIQAAKFADKYGNICPLGPRCETSQERESREYFSPL